MDKNPLKIEKKHLLGIFMLLGVFLIPTDKTMAYEEELSFNPQLDNCSVSSTTPDVNGYFFYNVNYGQCVITPNNKAFIANTTIPDGKFYVFTRSSLGTQSGYYIRVYLRDDLGFGQLIQYSTGCDGVTCDLNTPFVDASNWYRSSFDLDASTLPAGNWHVEFVQVAGSYPPNSYYGVFYTDNAITADTASEMYSYIDLVTAYGDDTPSSPPTPTTYTPQYIDILEPEYGTTTASTTVHISTLFSTPLSLNVRPTTTRKVAIYDAVTDELEYTYISTLGYNYSERTVYEFDATLLPGSKWAIAGYYTETGALYSELASTFFHVATNTYIGATGLTDPRDTPADLTQIDCDLFDVGCQFQKAITFLFYPSDTILNKFGNIWQSIATKKPFGYVTMTIGQLEDLDNTGSSAFDLGTLPFVNEIFTPMRTAVGAILWAIYAIFFYQRRLKHLDI